MDRLSALIVVAALVGCDDKSDAPGEAPSRVNAAKRGAPRAPGAAVEELCDVQFPADRGPTFAWPALAGAEPLAATGWRWINVWATWCKPCLEELPRLQRWKAELGGRVSLVFLSADESDQVVATFRGRHPEVPAGPRLADPDALPAWLTAIGLDAAAPIPVHVFVDPAGHTRCVRSGAVGDDDRAAIEQLLAP